MLFIFGLIVGLIVGGCVGIMVAALAVVAKQADERMEYLLPEEPED